MDVLMPSRTVVAYCVLCIHHDLLPTTSITMPRPLLLLWKPHTTYSLPAMQHTLPNCLATLHHCSFLALRTSCPLFDSNHLYPFPSYAFPIPAFSCYLHTFPKTPFQRPTCFCTLCLHLIYHYIPVYTHTAHYYYPLFALKFLPKTCLPGDACVCGVFCWSSMTFYLSML